MEMMKMYFHTGSIHLWFEGWKLDGQIKMTFACIGLFFLAIFYELFKFLRVYFYNFAIGRALLSSEETGLLTLHVPTDSHLHKKEVKVSWKCHLVLTLLYMVQLLVAYFLMLAVMTYSVFATLAIVIGAAFGYFGVAWAGKFCVDTGTEEQTD